MNIDWKEQLNYEKEYVHQIATFAKTNPAFLADSFLQGAEYGALATLGWNILKGTNHPVVKAIRVGSIGASMVMSYKFRKDMRRRAELEAIEKTIAILEKEGKTK